jgi:hypothetical protein
LKMNFSISALQLTRVVSHSPFIVKSAARGFRNVLFSSLKISKFANSFASLAMQNSRFQLSKSSFSDSLNSAIVLSSASYSSHAEFLRITSSFEITTSNFTGLRSTSSGAAVSVTGDSIVGTISNTAFVNNSAYMGGALSFESALGNLSISNAFFYNNSAIYGAHGYFSCAQLISTYSNYDFGNGTSFIHIFGDVVALFASTIMYRNRGTFSGTNNALSAVSFFECCIETADPNITKDSMFSNVNTVNWMNTTFNNASADANGVSDLSFCLVYTPSPLPTITVHARIQDRDGIIIVSSVAFFLILTIIGVIIGAKKEKQKDDDVALMDLSNTDSGNAEKPTAKPKSAPTPAQQAAPK